MTGADEPSSTHVVHLISSDGSVTVLVHQSTKPGYKRWQATYYHKDEQLSDTSYDLLDEALHCLCGKGFVIDKAR